MTDLNKWQFNPKVKRGASAPLFVYSTTTLYKPKLRS
jgi:hypothetical protein